MNTEHTHRGYVIKAELDVDGEPTGVFLVISTDGQVVHSTDSFEKAVKWIDKLEGDPKPSGGKKFKR